MPSVTSAALRNRDIPLATRCRLAFLEGAIEAWREANGSEPSPDLMVRKLARYPGNPAEVTACFEEARDARDESAPRSKP